MNNLWKKNQGFTYIEVLMCLVILSLMMTAMNDAFLGAIKINRTTKEIEEVTHYTEKLLEDIKYQMTQDIGIQQKILGSRYKIEGKSKAEIQKAKQGVGGYLIGGDRGAQADVIREEISLREFLSSIDESDLTLRYGMDKYAYQIALWRISDISWEEYILTWNRDSLKKATKIYSDSSVSNFDLLNNTEVEKSISFQITPEMLKIFQDISYSYIPYQITHKKILDKNKIQFNESGIPEIIHNIPKDEAIHINQCEILDQRGIKNGYVFHIYEGAIHETEAIKDTYNYRSIIELDVRDLIRKSEDLSDITAYNRFTFKFVNHTAYDQFIYICKNLIETEDQEEVNNKFNVILEDQKDGKSLMIQTNDIKPYENYLIAIVVRDKYPVQGIKGKIVKKMIDVYSYDMNRYE